MSIVPYASMSCIEHRQDLVFLADIGLHCDGLAAANR